ncbi:MAG: DUF2723 domain-containing protein [candidate division Zixibacteria bacterium]
MEPSLFGQEKKFDRINAVIAAIVTIITFIIYRLTVAQTLSYWDCGEFIASSHILGNPHPPGTPMFMLVGRFFDLLPIASDVAFRINMMSAISSTFSALFAYLITVRLVSSWYVNTENYKIGRIIAYASGFIGSLFVAFSRANWNNSVETEPRSMAILIMLAMLWLSLKWFNHRFSNTGQRIILLTAFLATISLGIHLTVFLIVPIVTIIFGLKRTATKIDWALISGFFIIQLILILILADTSIPTPDVNIGEARYKIFLILAGLQFVGLAIYMRNKVNWPIFLAFGAISPIMVGFYPFMFSVLGWLVISFFVWFVKRDKLWRLSFLIILFAIIGYSVHVYIPIRSSMHPIIDENTPSRDFRTFVNFLDRKQYGSTSMTERMFVRRGELSNQFGDHARMGFLRFFKEQYSSEKLFPVFLVIGIFGLGMMAYKYPDWGYIFITLVLVGSVGLVLYMNFADGTHFNKYTGDAYQEVRDRYYFFTPAFVLFGMAIGLGMAGIMELIRKATVKMGKNINRMAVYTSLILVLTPIIPAQASYFNNDRSKNRMAYNYAWNILNSCEKNSILFTAGDNDTFPVWCIQEIYGIRKDVRVINFSLLNTDWYIWQMKHLDSLSAINAGFDPAAIPWKDGKIMLEGREVEPVSVGILPDVPISMKDDQILWEVDIAPNGQEITRPQKPFYDRVRKRTALLVPTYYEEKTLKVAQIMLEDIILTNRWKYPIHFTSAAGEVRNTPLKLMDRLYRDGIILTLSTDETRLAYREDRTDSLFFEVYKYDNLSDTLIAQSENIAGISLAFPEKMLDYHSYLMENGKTEKADTVLEKICEAIPSYWRSRLTQAQRARENGDTLRAMEIEIEMKQYLHGFLNNNPTNVFFHQYLGTMYLTLGDNRRAEEYLNNAWELNRDKSHTFRALLSLYGIEGRGGDLVRLAQEYSQYHDDDPYANDILRRAQSFMDQQRLAPPPPATQNTPPVQIVPPDPGDS